MVIVMIHRWTGFSWHGMAGVILSACVGIGWAIALVITALQEGPVTESGATILNTIGGGLIGAVATWIGLAGGKKPHDPDINEAERRTSTVTETTEPLPAASPGTPARETEGEV